ncbi:hypothetical protein HK102_013889, partial [Quaeritorhiza haematococci]
PKVSTLTVSTFLNDKPANILDAAKFCPLDDKIIGIKTSYAGNQSHIIRGNVRFPKSERSFFQHQVTFTVMVGDRKVCCKLFNTGCLHITGCTTLDQVVKAANALTAALHRKMDLVDGRVWITREFVDKQKLIYNLAGTEIGRVHQTDQGLKYEWISMANDMAESPGATVKTGATSVAKTGATSVAKTGATSAAQTEATSAAKSEATSAAQTEATSATPDTNDAPFPILVHPFQIFPTESQPQIFRAPDFEIHMINAFLKYPYKIRRSVMSQALIANGHYVRYNPSSYPGVNLRYYCNDLNETGICPCKSTMIRCSCKVISVMFFYSGNVIITGMKSHAQLAKVANFVKSFVLENKTQILVS